MIWVSGGISGNILVVDLNLVLFVGLDLVYKLGERKIRKGSAIGWEVVV